MIRVLIVDDEVKLALAFQKRLSSEDGMEVSIASTGAKALSLAKTGNFDVVILDIKLPDVNGVELFERLRQMQPTLEVIMLTGYASIDSAVASMKTGAYDYLVKPIELSKLSSVIQKAYEKKSLRERNIVLEEQLSRIKGRDEFVGESVAIKEVRRLISVVSGSNTPVLILGETGTGKELVAQAIHGNSARSKNAFVVVDSNTLQENIFESEIFGYKKGAFTGAEGNKMGLLEMADKGTLFVDEVGDMGPGIQAKFLRVLETGSFRKVGDTRETKVDSRFIFATNKNLDREVQERRFRPDLLYRLNTFVIALPPLRERGEDIEVLAHYFLRRLAKGGLPRTISKSALRALTGYHWPGNVRELSNVMERAFLLSSSRAEIGLEELPPNMFPMSRKGLNFSAEGQGADLPTLTQLERTHIRRVLESVGGNKSKAARLLGISRKKLYNSLA
jgi:DNA-binding NtrC family response regulator